MATCMSHSFRILCLTFGLTLSASAAAPASAEPTTATKLTEVSADAQDFSLVRVAGPFNHPWSIAFLPDGRLLVSERWGELKVVSMSNGEQKVLCCLPPRPTEDHAGLMEVALDPDFATNKTIFLSLVHGDRSAATVRLLKARLDLDTYKLEDSKIIYESGPPAGGLEEFGGRIVFDKDGYLFMSLGDRYDRKRAQDLSDAHGSIIRLNRDGSIPQDNPFVGQAGARPEIWTYGHRNPQGLAIDPQTGIMWAHEHGPMGGDELNIIQRGKNYGWPIITYGTEYDGNLINQGLTHAEGMEQPVYYWVPSIAPSGLAIYHGAVAKWHNTIWLGGLAGQVLVRLTMDNNKVVREERFQKNELGRIRDVRNGPDGFIYFSVDDLEGSIYRAEPRTRQAMRRTTKKTD